MLKSVTGEHIHSHYSVHLWLWHQIALFYFYLSLYSLTILCILSPCFSSGFPPKLTFIWPSAVKSDVWCQLHPVVFKNTLTKHGISFRSTPPLSSLRMEAVLLNNMSGFWLSWGLVAHKPYMFYLNALYKTKLSRTGAKLKAKNEVVWLAIYVFLQTDSLEEKLALNVFLTNSKATNSIMHASNQGQIKQKKYSWFNI